MEGVIQEEGHPGEVAQIFQEGKEGEEDGHGGKHNADHPGQHPVHPQHQGIVEPEGGVEPQEQLREPVPHPEQAGGQHL